MHSKIVPPSVNFHLWQPCNMRCKFCFATFLDVKQTLLPKGHLPPEHSMEVVRQLAQAGFLKITFAGGEPTLCPWLRELVRVAHEMGMKTMLVTNGSRLTVEYLKPLQGMLDWIVLSIDSLQEETNAVAGRAENGKGPITEAHYIHLAHLVKEMGFRLKINTVVNAWNHAEDMSAFISLVKPERWKVLQALPVAGQNSEHAGSFEVSSTEFEAFLSRHAGVKALTELVPESNDAITGSYVMVDPAGRFFDDVDGTHQYSAPILGVGVKQALAQVRFDAQKFEERSGRYEY